MRRHRILAVLLAAVVAPASAVAEEGRWFVHLYTGLGLTEDSDLRVRLPGQGLDLLFEQVSWEDHSLGRPSIPCVGVRVGR